MGRHDVGDVLVVGSVLCGTKAGAMNATVLEVAVVVIMDVVCSKSSSRAVGDEAKDLRRVMFLCRPLDAHVGSPNKMIERVQMSDSIAVPKTDEEGIPCTSNDEFA